MQGNTHLHSRYRPHTTVSRSTAGIATTMSAHMYVQHYLKTDLPLVPLAS
jgi:hypothetical protein